MTPHTVHTQSPWDVIRGWKQPPAAGEPGRQILVRNAEGHAIGALTPVTGREAEDTAVCAALTRWRRMFRQYFLTQFEPTAERTRDWLLNVVLPDDSRLLFLIRDENHNPVGNFGICGIGPGVGELDNLIRGQKGGDAKLVYYSELALLDWMYRELQTERVCLHVFSSNAKTLLLHTSVGFEQTQRQPLARITDGAETRYVPWGAAGEPAGFDLVRMELGRDAFRSLYPWI